MRSLCAFLAIVITMAIVTPPGHRCSLIRDVKYMRGMLIGYLIGAARGVPPSAGQVQSPYQPQYLSYGSSQFAIQPFQQQQQPQFQS